MELVIGSVVGLAILAILAVALGRMNDLDDRCRCNGNCMQGRECLARRRR